MSADLWSDRRAAHRRAAEPLAVRMRPRTLDAFVGQEHFLGPGRLLRRILEADRLTSLIFYGPPGTGKTTLAELVAHYTQRHFERGNAAAIGVKEVRDVLERAARRLEDDGRRTIFFLDEIHRFNRAQQDVLLGDVERGTITLIGATTENPFFAVNAPLVSRSQVFQFQPLSEEHIRTLLRRAMTDKQHGLGHLRIEISDEAIDHWARMSDGDGRRALSALEIAVLSQGRAPAAGGQAEQTGLTESGSGPRTSSPAGQASNPDARTASLKRQAASPSDRPIVIDLAVAEQSIQQKAIVYDGTGDEHYDAASALIKSMRGSDPDAAIYWLAKMLVAGEDPLFIARRIAILASEDIGNADPQALQVAASAYQVSERIGLPECQLTLAQAVIYMATAPKSNASAKAIWQASKDVRENRTVSVPRHLRDGHYASAQRLGHAQGYQYPHDAPGGFVDQEYLGVDRQYYVPTNRGHEERIGRFLEWIRQQRSGTDAAAD